MLKVSRSSYYKRKKKCKSKRVNQNEKILEMIKQIFTESKERYGSPGISAELNRRGIVCNTKRIARIMRENDIEARIFRKFRKYRKTTLSDHQRQKSDNLLNREFNRREHQMKCGHPRYYIHTNIRRLAISGNGNGHLFKKSSWLATG